MERLVDECIDFVSKYIEDVIKLPIDMSCLNPRLLKKLACQFDIEKLDLIKDRKDKLVSKLYTKKLEALLEEERNILQLCTYCNKIFTMEQREWMTCPKAKIFIDFHGNVIAKHVADRLWDINKFILFLKNHFYWREIYWKV